MAVRQSWRCVWAVVGRRGVVRDVAWETIETVVGPVTLAASGVGLRRVRFGRRGADGPGGGVVSGAAERMLGVAREQLVEYFAGAREVFDVPLDWSASSGSRLVVLRTLWERVPFGRTVSYVQLGRWAGFGDAARMVGGVMGGNPIAIVVPCHRVIAADGGLGGFGGGLAAKRTLLSLEGSLAPTLF
jgi:methylated-DNA-[protein]-cysteine S-methyltransferase